MSIAPFLPGLVAPIPGSASAPTEAGTTTGTANGQATEAQPGAEGEVAFMDALAAALAVQPPVAMAPATPATPATPAAPATPAVPATSATPATPAVRATPATAATPTPELGVVTPELGVVTPETEVPPATSARAPSTSPASPEPTTGKPGAFAHLVPEETAPEVSVRTTTSVDVPTDLAKVPASFELPTTNPHSAVTSTDSIVTNPNSAVTNTDSAVTNPKSVERAVVAQVFPEVTRLASSGNGTHRITLTLQPAQLGEVRVTLVVRDGTVRVRMSGEAGDGAVRQALASGAPELQRMLERAGATEARVLVRDVNATPLPAMPTLPTPAARNDFSQAWSGQSDQQQPGQPGQSGQAQDFGQSRGEGRDGHPGRSGHPFEPAGRRAPAADVVPGSTPTPGRLDRNL